MKKKLLIIPVLFLLSCNKNKVFEKFEKIDNYEWNMNRVIKFDVPIQDTSVAYKVSVPVRHIENYPYDGLLINFTYTSPAGEKRSKNYKLAFRDADGKFMGDGAGDIWDESPVLMENAKFNATGTYKFEIVNNMDKTPTPCIMEIGLKIEKVN